MDAPEDRVGGITTWKWDGPELLRHTSRTFGPPARFRIEKSDDSLVFLCISSDEEDDWVERRVYAEYHGYMITTLVTHFQPFIDLLGVTTDPTVDESDVYDV